MTALRILVLNANSNAAVTDVIHAAVERLGLSAVELSVDQLDAAADHRRSRLGIKQRRRRRIWCT